MNISTAFYFIYIRKLYFTVFKTVSVVSLKTELNLNLVC